MCNESLFFLPEMVEISMPSNLLIARHFLITSVLRPDICFPGDFSTAYVILRAIYIGYLQNKLLM